MQGLEVHLLRKIRFLKNAMSQIFPYFIFWERLGKGEWKGLGDHVTEENCSICDADTINDFGLYSFTAHAKTVYQQFIFEEIGMVCLIGGDTHLSFPNSAVQINPPTFEGNKFG